MSISRRQFLQGLAATGALGAVGGLAGCSQASGGEAADGYELFQFKSEAIKYFDEVCAQFKSKTGLTVRQNFQADNVAALRVRLVKETIPDMITINGDYGFGSLASTSIFADIRHTPIFDSVLPAVGEILGTLGRGGDSEVNGYPLSTNGSGMIYNKEIFAANGVTPPTTWDELIEVCDKLKANGVAPFMWGFKDTWTGAPMFSSISGNFLTDGVAAWYDKRRNGEVSFQDIRPVMEKMKQIAAYGNEDKAALGYNDASQAFALGKAAMYVHGTYAIPAIRSYNKDIQLGTFATPADKEEDTKVVSGVDVALVLPREYKPEAMQFFEFLMSPEAMNAYCTAQVAYPTLKGSTVSDDALKGLQPYFDANRVATYSDHNFPPAVNLNAYMQQFLLNGDVDGFANTLDEQWDKVMDRLNRTR